MYSQTARPRHSDVMAELVPGVQVCVETQVTASPPLSAAVLLRNISYHPDKLVQTNLTSAGSDAEEALTFDKGQ